jgi:hypothetical protein
MNQPFSLATALCLPAPEVEALRLGRTIVAIPQTFLRPGKRFALCPTGTSILPISLGCYYRANFVPVAQEISSQFSIEKAAIKIWAKCQFCQVIDAMEDLESLSRLTVWTGEGLREILNQRQTLFLAALRVYFFPQINPLESNLNPHNKVGKFIGLPQSLSVTETSPVLSDRVFSRRCHQLENRLPPDHPELEDLQGMIAQLTLKNPEFRGFDEQIKAFLGWSDDTSVKQSQANLDWIDTIAALGNRSQEEDEGKSNYQAGTDFENVVRKSLEFLGFTVDHFHRGGAGGVDVFCSQPYPLICECKAGKKIPNTTAVQLLNLGNIRLANKEQFQKAAKLIIGPGEPTPQLNDAARKQDMAIIRPETLEKLVKLQALFNHSIDLFKLKNCLQAGKSDQEVEIYIEQVEQQIKLRSRIIKAVQELSDQETERAEQLPQQFTVTEIRAHYNATQNPRLTDEEVCNILIELSSPLTGYLGREPAPAGQSDRFYFLQELKVESIA